MTPRCGKTEAQLTVLVDELVKRCEGQGQKVEHFCADQGIDVRIVALAIGSQVSTEMQLRILLDLVELGADLAGKGERVLKRMGKA